MRRFRGKPGTWWVKGRGEVAVRDLSDSELGDALQLIERHQKAIRIAMGSLGQPARLLGDAYPPYKWLAEEASRRGLDRNEV
jgi:hypothetical protein